MSHEKEVFTQIAEARSKIGSNNKEEKQQGEQELSSAISRLLVLSENYPQLKTDAQATNLITELEGTENRIATARIDYNKVATEYNKSIRRFPTNITAKLFDFEKVELTKADVAETKQIVTRQHVDMTIEMMMKIKKITQIQTLQQVYF